MRREKKKILEGGKHIEAGIGFFCASKIHSLALTFVCPVYESARELVALKLQQNRHRLPDIYTDAAFCLRRSPDHGTVDVVVVVLVGGTTLIFDFFQDTEIFIK